MLALVAIALGVIGAVIFTLGIVYAYRNTLLVGSEVRWIHIAWGSFTATVVAVGVVISVARPRFFIGWGLLAVGLSIDVTAFGQAYGGWERLSGQGLPLSDLVVWLAMVASGVFPMMAPLVVTRLPLGRPDGRMARLTSRVSWVLGLALVGWWAIGNDVLTISMLSDGALPRLPNPVALLHPDRAITAAITTTLTTGLVACWVTAALLVFVRRRRASAVERAQLRWLAYGCLGIPAVAAITLVVHFIAPSFEEAVSTVLFPVLGLGAIPVSIAISVLKFRLFEIDRLISRTVVFAIVALVLGALYVALAILPFTLLVGVGGDGAPSWVVTASTLTAAALFSPLRRRVQRLVDRRFNRSRYDAERVIERFSAEVREFTDVDTIAAGVAGVVRGALQPARMAVWVRGAGS
jgi:hypothetical protein